MGGANFYHISLNNKTIGLIEGNAKIYMMDYEALLKELPEDKQNYILKALEKRKEEHFKEYKELQQILSDFEDKTYPYIKSFSEGMNVFFNCAQEIATQPQGDFYIEKTVQISLNTGHVSALVEQYIEYIEKCADRAKKIQEVLDAFDSLMKDCSSKKGESILTKIKGFFK